MYGTVLLIVGSTVSGWRSLGSTAFQVSSKSTAAVSRTPNETVHRSFQAGGMSAAALTSSDCKVGLIRHAWSAKNSKVSATAPPTTQARSLTGVPTASILMMVPANLVPLALNSSKVILADLILLESINPVGMMMATVTPYCVATKAKTGSSLASCGGRAAW
jgi:hypothetical protein